MTTYVNEEKQGYGKAVKATLAATLAVGMVPAAGAAFADEPAEAAEGNDVELLAVSPDAAFKAGKVTAAKDNADKAIADLANVTFVADGKPHYIVPTELVPNESTTAVDLKSGYTFKYFKLNDKGEVEGKAIDDPNTIVGLGTYGVKVVKDADASGDISGYGIAATFTIASASLKDATLIEGDDVTDTEFVYTGKSLDLGLALNGKKLKVGTDYTIEFKKPNSAVVANPMNAGDYVAVVKGAGIYANQTAAVNFNFTIAPIDLSKAKVEFGDVTELTLGANIADKITVGGAAGKDLVVAEITSVPSDIVNDSKGVYGVAITPAKDNKNVVGSCKAEYVKVADKTAVIKYDNTTSIDVETDNSAAKPKKFDVSKLEAFTADGTKIDKAEFIVTVKDAKGNVVDNSSLNKPGTWTVEVSIDAAKNGYAYAEANPLTGKVVVKNGEVNAAADVFVKYDGNVTTGDTLNYTGEDFLKKVSVVVKFGDKTLAEGSDYKVELTKTVDAKEVAVDSMVDAGDYTLTVSSDSYFVGTNPLKDTVKFKVNPADVTDIVLDPATVLPEAVEKLPAISYTGAAIVPSFQCTIDKKAVALPEGSYTMTVKDKNGKAVKEIKELGKYTVEFADASEKDNFKITAPKPVEFYVSDQKQFADVPNTEWFYGHVYDAHKAGYMSGIGNSSVFAPNDATTRAMAATVLSRMAGADCKNVSEPFSDVFAGEWFAEEVAWAASTGIVAGYPGTDEFRPGNNVTRAEFCIMMQRYAEMTKQGVALEAGEADKLLEGYADAAAVEPWCKDAIAWAVKNKIFGGHTVLNPAGDITRAEMAKMTTAFQPEALKAPAKPGQGTK